MSTEAPFRRDDGLPYPATPPDVANYLRGYSDYVFYEATRSALLRAADELDKEPKP